jgi:hypothetical protein
MVDQQRHVLVVAAKLPQLTGKAFDRHVGDGQQTIEPDTEIPPQLVAISRLELRLRRREAWADRIINQVEQQLI